MLDIRLIRENPDFVKQRLATRGGGAHLQIDTILEIDAERRRLETRLQHLNGERKRISKAIGMKKKQPNVFGRLQERFWTKAFDYAKSKEVEIARLNKMVAEKDDEQHNLLLNLPNLPHDAATVGKDASENPVVKTWGEKPPVANPLDHIELGKRLGLFLLKTHKLLRALMWNSL